MAIYSIKDLEKLSGIKAHTLRMWEKRYGIIKPQRTPTNIRYYQDDDLKQILNIALLNKNGIKISKIAEMSQKEIAQKVAAISEINFEYGTQLDALTISMIEMDEYKFDSIISTNIEQLGLERTMLEVIYPFLDKLGMLWLTGSINPVQENFITCLIRQKLLVAIDKLSSKLNEQSPVFLLYLPEGEQQELSMLFLHYLLRKRGKNVVYLGQNIGLADLKDAHHILKPEYIYTMITETFTKEPVQHYVNKLSTIFPETTILLSGYQIAVQEVISEKNIVVLKSLDNTIEFVEKKSQK